MPNLQVPGQVVTFTPRRARALVEALVVDNLDICRPESLELIFTGRGPGSEGRPIENTQQCRTSVIAHETEVSVSAYFKHSGDGRALRIETAVNSPDDLTCRRRPVHRAELQAKAPAANARLLETERVGQGCVLASPAFERVALSPVTASSTNACSGRYWPPTPHQRCHRYTMRRPPSTRASHFDRSGLRDAA